MLKLVARQIIKKRLLKRNRLSADLLARKDELVNDYSARFSGDVKLCISELCNAFSIESKPPLLTDVEINKFKREIEHKAAEFSRNDLRLGGLDEHEELIVSVCSMVDNLNILEIGVANGYSSAFFHYLLKEYFSDGGIDSIDRPIFESDLARSDRLVTLFKIKMSRLLSRLAYPDNLELPKYMWRGGVIPNNKYCGWLVDPLLRKQINSRLFIGDAFAVLSDLGKGGYDVVLLDAMKDEKIRISLMEEVLPTVKNEGFIMQDGGWRNDACKIFSEKHGFRYVEIGRVSIIRIVR